MHKNRNSYTKRWLFAPLLLFGLLVLQIVGPASVSADATIADRAAAATYCRANLPDGVASTGLNYCAFTITGAPEKCVVTDPNSTTYSPSEYCAKFKLSDMVGKKESDIKALADAYGAIQTTGVLPNGAPKGDCKPPPGTELDKDNCKIVLWIGVAINILSALVGLVIIGVIIIGGIQYTSSADDPQAIGAAKKKIANAILALVIFIFMYTFLQWIVPGGIF